MKPFLCGVLTMTAILAATFALSSQTRVENPHGPIAVECSNCHTAEGWTTLRRPLLFDHTQHTGFPLRFAHKGVNCSGCHRDLRFSHVGSACADCHEDPHRAELGFDCERCHDTTGWQNRARILEVHSAALFPLTGAHVSVECSECHLRSPERFFGAQRQCINCHQQDLARATPSHAGFPRECETCHSTARFEGAFFPNHDQLFPIFSGPHRNAWDSCADCHTNQNNFRVFSCVTCHEHRRDEMDDEHDDVRNYRYESTACLSCHPDGRER